MPTSEKNARDIAALTEAVGALVSRFIRPNSQQALENQQSIARIIELMDRHARAIVEIDARVEANAQLIAGLGERLEQFDQRLKQFDQRLEETRQLVAKNGSDIAQMGARHDAMFARMDERLDRTDRQLEILVEENRAFRELQRSQLAAITNNAQRIDRLEQPAV